jgi:DNA-binding NarL/FixJ family response regulator
MTQSPQSHGRGQIAPPEAPRLRRLLLIDDHAILRDGLHQLLSAESDLEVIGEAATLAQGLALAASLQAEVIIMDLTFPIGHGLDVIGQLRGLCPVTRVVVLSVHSTEECVEAALKMGAHAYVRKSSSFKDLLLAIRGTGQALLMPAPNGTTLTRRELQILLGVARGMTNKQIAAQLSRSVKTVDKHRANMMHKLALEDAGAVTRYAIANGYLSPLRASYGDCSPSTRAD